MMKRRITIFFTLCLALICALSSFACGNRKDKSNLVCTLVESTDSRVIISVSDEGLHCTLLDCMELLRQKNDELELNFTCFGGMMTSINGVENSVDYSKCWMLYTSDSEMANTQWGTTEYNGKTYGSAIVGVGELEVIADGIYIWVYQTF